MQNQPSSIENTSSRRPLRSCQRFQGHPAQKEKKTSQIHQQRKQTQGKEKILL